MPVIRISQDTEHKLKELMLKKIKDKLKHLNKKEALLQIAHNKFGVTYDEIISDLL